MGCGYKDLEGFFSLWRKILRMLVWDEPGAGSQVEGGAEMLRHMNILNITKIFIIDSYIGGFG